MSFKPYHYITTLLMACCLITSCKKTDDTDAAKQSAQTKTFSAEVATRWLNMELNMFRLPLAAGTTAPAADRALAYAGITLYESVVPGMPAYQSLVGQLNQLPLMPVTEPSKKYHWAASANAALAVINRSLFPGTSQANKDSINNLETLLQNQYALETDAETLQRSIDFGRAVATAVFSWAATDGTSAMPATSTYTPPSGPGLWVPTTAGAFAVNPFHQMRRQMVTGSRDGALAPAPIPYSADPSSAFYAMGQEVYNIFVNRTPEQANIAMYHAEGSGYGGGSSMVAQLSQLLSQTNSKLDKAALVYVKAGIGTYEGLTYTFIQKYTHNVLRPITYIRNVMGRADFNTMFATPMYPEYPAGHPTNGGILAVMLANEFGTNLSFDFNYYDYLGRPARHYNNFEELAQEMAIARVYAGIHFKPGVDAGVLVGKKVAQNILTKLRFLK
ncbi:MAG: superfamily protein [Ferruginibacter sp.]|nr:superfamily protein [Ferruginibacter sp.]